MRAHQQFPIQKMAKCLKVSRSGFYCPRKELFQTDLDVQIRGIFMQHKGRYGSPRIWAELKKRGSACSRYQVETRMRFLGLYAGKKKRRPKTTLPGSTTKDLLKRDFVALGPNQKWCGDISYIRTKKGFVYLSVILDLYSRKIVGWQMADHMEQSLILKTLEKALSKRAFSGRLIFHTDRGSQYRADAVQKLLKGRGIESSQGLCAYDNAVAESFFGSLKAELLPKGKSFHDLEEAKREVFKYIEVYYNRQRMHSTLGYMSPMQYEEKMKVLA